MLQFEWDPDKAVRNFEKHGVSFQDAATVFGDKLSYTFDDPDHSDEELRFLTVGFSQTGKLLIIAHADRNDKVRIISAREVTKRERRFFEGG